MKCEMFRKVLTLFIAGAALSLSAETSVAEIDLSKVKTFEFKTHVDEKNAPPPQGSAAKTTAAGIEMDFVFPTAKHDAAMVIFPANVPACDTVQLELTADQKGGRLFMIVKDAGGEYHYFSLIESIFRSKQAIAKTGRWTTSAKLPLRNRYAGEYLPHHWGGDDNQKIDFPLKEIWIGLNDFPDTMQMKGKLILHKLKFIKK